MAGWKTFAVGDVLTASDTMQYLQNGPHVEVARTTNQTISNSTATDVSWTVENSDRQSLIAVTTATFTVPSTSGQAGVWLISFMARFAANAVGFRLGQTLLNGAFIAENRDVANTIAAQPHSIEHTTAKLLVATDAIKVSVFQSSGGNLDLDTSTSAPLRLTLQRLGD